MSRPLDNFRHYFLHADSWELRKDGVPLHLLDALSPDDLAVAEAELIRVAGPGDSWPISGLGHIRSQAALPKLYQLLLQSRGAMRITIAHAIFQICGDPAMIDVVLEDTPGLGEYDLIEILYLLPDFKHPKTDELLHALRGHKDYLVAYNATRALGLPTEEVVENFRKKPVTTAAPMPPPEDTRPWWRKLFGM